MNWILKLLLTAVAVVILAYVLPGAKAYCKAYSSGANPSCYYCDLRAFLIGYKRNYYFTGRFLRSWLYSS
jgi:hypothetical protein